MADKKTVTDGYTPKSIKKGYQPKDTSGGKVTGGYQPTKSEGDGPANKPPPKKP